jgi:DNA-binding LytR/AlgR family response regulator
MKFTIQQISDGENELILKYLTRNEEVERALEFMNGCRQKLIGEKDGQKEIINRSDMLYIESVDGRCFVYTQADVFAVDFTLTQLEQILESVNFFRCSKSTIINIDKVHKLRSLASNRIDVTMNNGEHIIISRTYASNFRKRLKGVNEDA